jgi:voltage-dependent potassium channel beta subunit
VVYRRVGKSGLKISAISIGAWLTYGGSVEAKAAEPVIKAALEAGINFIDIADIYARGKAEEAVGMAIKGLKRSDLVISSKLFWPMTDNINDRGLSRKHIMESIDKSLKRIGTDYLDIYFCHRPDSETEIEETVRAMEDLIRQGKILYWGTSLWSSDMIEEAVGRAREWRGYLPTVEQPRYNMLDRHIENEIIPVCEKYGLGLTVWSPLAQGLLSGKYNDGIPATGRGATTEWLKRDMIPENLAKVKELAKVAADLKITVGQLALAWILRLPQISCAITGATAVPQVLENVKAAEIALSDETLDRIEQILDNAPEM